jgi:hypothetical protein
MLASTTPTSVISKSTLRDKNFFGRSTVSRKDRIDCVSQLVKDYTDAFLDLQSDGSLVLWAIEVGKKGGE